MRLLRFLRPRHVDGAKGDPELSVLAVSPVEAYWARPESVCYFMSAPLYGYMRQRRRELMTVRRGDAMPMHLAAGQLPHTLNEDDLVGLESQAFRMAEASMEKRNGSGSSPVAEKVLLAVLGFEMLLVLGAGSVRLWMFGEVL